MEGVVDEAGFDVVGHAAAVDEAVGAEGSVIHVREGNA